MSTSTTKKSLSPGTAWGFQAFLVFCLKGIHREKRIWVWAYCRPSSLIGEMGGTKVYFWRVNIQTLWRAWTQTLAVSQVNVYKSLSGKWEQEFQRLQLGDSQHLVIQTIEAGAGGERPPKNLMGGHCLNSPPTWQPQQLRPTHGKVPSINWPAIKLDSETGQLSNPRNS